MKKKKKKKNLAMEEFEKEFGDAPEASAAAKPKKSKKVVEESDDEADGEDGEGDFDEVFDIDLDLVARRNVKGRILQIVLHWLFAVATEGYSQAAFR